MFRFIVMELTAYSTHLPVLQQYIMKTTGDIIELGTGDYSTGFILSLIENTNRKLISLENDEQWYNRVKSMYPETDNHVYHFYNDYLTELDDILDRYQSLSIAFIDSSPMGPARTHAMKYYKRNPSFAEYVIIHDVDYYAKNDYFGSVVKEYDDREPDFDFSDVSLNYQLYYPPVPYPYFTGPPTLIVSFCNKPFFNEFQCSDPLMTKTVCSLTS